MKRRETAVARTCYVSAIIVAGLGLNAASFAQNNSDTETPATTYD